MLDQKKLSKIGIGTWGIGGFMERDNSIDEGKQVDAIAYMLSNGMNFVEANMFYSEGYSVEILAKAIEKSGIKREDLFVCQAIYLKGDKRIPEAREELTRVLDLLGTDYVDTIQFSMGSFLLSSFEEITDWIDEVLEGKQSRYTSITNANLDLLKQYHEKFTQSLFSHEVVFNFEMRANEELGIIDYGEKNEIKTVVYQPLRRNRTAKLNWEPITKLAEKYDKSQNQIIMNWITSKGYLPLTKSETISHIDEHLDSLKFEMDQADLNLLSNYKLPNFTPPKIDWYKTGDGVSIDQLSNVFEDIYKQS